MKKLNFFLMYLVVSGSTCIANSTLYYQSTLDYLNIHQRPDYSSPIVGQLMRTDIVGLIFTSDQWCSVYEVSKSNMGFVAMKFIIPVDLETPASGKFNKYKVLIRGQQERYSIGIWQYLNHINRNISIITWFCLIISVVTGIVLFYFLKRTYTSNRNGWKQTFHKSLMSNINSDNLLFVIISITETMLSLFVTLFFLQMAIYSFGVEFGIILSLFLWLFGVIMIPFRLPALINKFKP